MAVRDYNEVNGLIILKKKHRMIQHIQEVLPTPEIHGNQIWGSSFLIMDYLDQFPPKQGANITEIGCGWGLLGIYCAKEFDAKVTAVDADDHVFPFLDTHAIINDVKISTRANRYEELKVKDLRGQELMLGGDICFWDELVDPLYDVIDKAVRAKVKRIVVADPGRSPFMKLAKRCKKDFGAELYEWDISKPRKVDGYLLEIENT